MPQCCGRGKHQTQTVRNTDLRIKQICLWNQVQPLSENVNLVWILRLPEFPWRKLSKQAENWAKNKWTNSSIKSSCLVSLVGWPHLVLCFEYNKHLSVAYARLSVGRIEEREGNQREIFHKLSGNRKAAKPDLTRYRFNHLSLLKGQALSPPLSQN